jgi:hypothetical protein
MNTDYYSEDPSKYLLKFRAILHYLLIPILILLVVVLYFEFFAHLSHSAHKKLKIAERIILVYFIGEVTTDFVLFDDKREFFSEKWFDILLIIPFLQTFKAVGQVGRAFQGIKIFKSLQLSELTQASRLTKTVKFSEIPLVAGTIVGESTRGLRLADLFPKFLKSVPKLQKFLHFLRGLPELIKHIPNIQSIVYLTTQTKLVMKKLMMFLVPTSILLLLGMDNTSEK